jgi:GT2 family glycosyltransferase
MLTIARTVTKSRVRVSRYDAVSARPLAHGWVGRLGFLDEPRVHHSTPRGAGVAGSLRASILIINRDDVAVADTLEALDRLEPVASGDVEVVVVDASSGRLAHIRERHPRARWIDFPALNGRTTIPHQRNLAVRESTSETLIFIDASCVPDDGWLEELLEPIEQAGETIVAGSSRSSTAPSIRDHTALLLSEQKYIREAPTINLALRKSLFEQIGGFDESFGYGSDVDFTWRAREAGYRIRYVPEAVVHHDWGDPGREMRRSYTYGKARARLYLKHPRHWRELFDEDIMALAYPVYLLALPLSFFRRLRWLPLLVLIPLIRNRDRKPVSTLADHLLFGAGILSEVASRSAPPRSA